VAAESVGALLAVTGPRLPFSTTTRSPDKRPLLPHSRLSLSFPSLCARLLPQQEVVWYGWDRGSQLLFRGSILSSASWRDISFS
jgi:hypothetical protein